MKNHQTYNDIYPVDLAQKATYFPLRLVLLTNRLHLHFNLHLANYVYILYTTLHD